jgi:hypothetical protein
MRAITKTIGEQLIYLKMPEWRKNYVRDRRKWGEWGAFSFGIWFRFI